MARILSGRKTDRQIGKQPGNQATRQPGRRTAGRDAAWPVGYRGVP